MIDKVFLSVRIHTGTVIQFVYSCPVERRNTMMTKYYSLSLHKTFDRQGFSLCLNSYTGTVYNCAAERINTMMTKYYYDSSSFREHFQPNSFKVQSFTAE